MLTQTPLVMTLIGAEFRQLYVAPHVFNGLFSKEEIKNPRHHHHPEMDRNVLKQLPEALSNPVAIFRSKGNSFVFMLPIKVNKDDTVIVPVELEANELKGKVNLLLTGYGKEKPDYFAT